MEMKIKPLAAVEDDQLKTPQHDKICITFLNKEVLLSYIQTDKIIQKEIQKDIQECNRTVNTKFYSYEKDNFITTKYLKHSIECNTPMLERTLKSGNGFIIGYIDLWVVFQITIEYERTEHNKTTIEKSIRTYDFGIEVKPTIKSVGETMRQLQTYKQNLRRPIAIASTSTEYKKIFEGQGFSFWQVG